jgi:DNA helicase-2/ATP-dependent DNA helicase PcrA
VSVDVNAAKRVLEGLDDRQRAAVTAPAGPLCIVAGAGTGKTRTITHRVAYQVHTGAFAARQTLAITHSRKAASELRTRFTDLGVGQVQANTFHAAALRQLGHFWAFTGVGTPRPNLLTDRRTAVRQAIANLSGLHPSAVASDVVMTVDGEITWAHAQLTSPSDYATRAQAAYRAPDVDVETVAAAYGAYESLKRERAVIDFDDILVYTSQLITRFPEVAESVRGVYTNFVVDEYQDTDPSQQALLDAWLGGRGTVTAVGDPAQTIFSFKGADPTLLLGFGDRYPGATKVELVTNYRSSPQVLDAANRLSSGLPGAVTLTTSNESGPLPAVRAYDDEDDEVRGIADLVVDAIGNGTSPREIAVLHRFNSQAPAIRAALASAGVAVSVRGDDEYFSKKEVASAMRSIHTAAEADPDDDGVSVVAEVLDAQGFLENEPPEGIGARRERWENQAALLDQARSLHTAGHVSVRDLLTELDKRAQLEHVPSAASGVTVTTIHKAKGLEWDVVIVARTTDGSLPSALAKTVGEQQEERRLAYVAATRARKSLYMTWPRKWGKHNSSSTPSPFHHKVAPNPVRSFGPAPTGRPAKGPTVDMSEFVVGKRVVHDQFGLGTIISVGDGRVTADYKDGPPRTVDVRGPIQPL